MIPLWCVWNQVIYLETIFACLELIDIKMAGLQEKIKVIIYRLIEEIL